MSKKTRTQADTPVLGAEDEAATSKGTQQFTFYEKVIARFLYNDPGYPFGALECSSNTSGIYHYTSRICRDVGFQISIMERVLNEWTKRGWYSYGVTVNTGWITDKGRPEITKLATS